MLHSECMLNLFPFMLQVSIAAFTYISRDSMNVISMAIICTKCMIHLLLHVCESYFYNFYCLDVRIEQQLSTSKVVLWVSTSDFCRNHCVRFRTLERYESFSSHPSQVLNIRKDSTLQLWLATSMEKDNGEFKTSWA